MGRFIKLLFSWPVSCTAGIVVVAVLVLLISRGDSVHSYLDHPAVDQFASKPLIPGVAFEQEVSIPEAFSGNPFILAIYFGLDDRPSSGGVEITLSQSDHSQTLVAADLMPENKLRSRFRFNGFKGGSAKLKISALGSNTTSAPGLLFIKEGKGPSLQGPGIPDNVYAAIDWFSIMRGNQKLESTFPNVWIGLLWFFPFAGVMALAWKEMDPGERS